MVHNEDEEKDVTDPKAPVAVGSLHKGTLTRQVNTRLLVKLTHRALKGRFRAVCMTFRKPPLATSLLDDQ